MKNLLICLGATIAVFLPNLLTGQWLGNDYGYTVVHQSLMYRFYLSQGIDPTWFPHIGGGMSMGAFFFAQPYHLPAFLLSYVPGFGEGWIRLVFGLKHILMLAGLLWLAWETIRRLIKSDLASLLLAVVLTFNLRSLDTVRFAIYLDTIFYFTVLLLLCVSFLSSSQRQKGFLSLIALATYLLVTSGYAGIYPYVFWFSLFYLMRLLWLYKPSLAKAASLFASVAIGLLLSSPVLFMILDFVSTGSGRMTNASVAWADYFPLSLPLFLENLFRPWEADLTSAFGGTALLTVFAIAFWRLPFLIPSFRSFRPLLWFSLGIILFAYGTHTPFFEGLFRLLPGVSTVRGPARALALLYPLILSEIFIFSRGKLDSFSMGAEGRQWLNRVANVSLVLMVLYYLVWILKARLYDTQYYHWTPDTVTEWWPWKGSLWIALAGLAVWALKDFLKTSSASALRICFLATFGQTVLVMSYGSWLEPIKTSETYERIHGSEHFPLIADFTYSTPMLDKGNTGAALPGMEAFQAAADPLTSCLLPFEKKDGNPQDFRVGFYLLPPQVKTDLPTDIRRLNDCDSLWQTLGLSRREVADLNRSNKVTCLTPNQVCLQYDSATPAMLMTGMPWRESGWEILLDGQPVPSKKIFSGLLGVSLPTGRHEIVVRSDYRWNPAGKIALTVAIVIFGLLCLLDFSIYRSKLMTSGAILVAMAAALGAWTFMTRVEENRTRRILLNTEYDQIIKTAFDRLPDESP